jgi:hypothetical protein
MCDLPHRRTLLGHFAGKDELNARIGIIIRKHFLKDAPPHDLSKASPAGAASAYAHGFPRKRVPRYRNPADFRYETVQWQGFNGPDSTAKDTKPKGFIP